MRLEERPLLLAHLLLGMFCLGIAWGSWRAPPAVFLVGGVLCLAGGGAYALLRRRAAAALALLGLFLLLGCLRYLQSAVIPASDISRSIGTVATVSGTVAAVPRVESSATGQVSVGYVIEAERVVGIAGAQLASGRFQAYLRQSPDRPIARPGDGIRIAGELQALHSYQNPGRIDGAATLRRQGVTARLKARHNGAVIEARAAWPLQRAAAALRESVAAAMRRAMPEADAAALFALLFGGYAGIRPELLEAFTVTGIIHILSVSGSHIALLAAAARRLGMILRLRPWGNVLLIAAVVCFYGALTGFVPPVVRAAIMGTLPFAALALGRVSDARRLLSLTALVMLIISPRLLYDISFQLSFGATAGLLYLAPPLRQGLGRLPKWLAANLALTAAAQLSVLPILAWYFNTVSISAFLANLLATPILEGIIAAGLIGVCAGLWPLLQNIFFVLCSLALGFVYNITSELAALPVGSLYLPTFFPAAGALYYALLGAGFGLLQGGRPLREKLAARRGLFIGGALLAALLFGGAAAWLRPAPLQVHFIDVGQGDAALVITPRGRAVLLDTGGIPGGLSDFDVGERVVAPYLRHYGVRALEYLVLTHAHDDHVGGAAAVCRRVPTRRIVIGQESRAAYARLLRTSPAALRDCFPAYAGQRWALDGVSFTVLDAPRGAAGNEASLVIRVDYGAQRFLITGDLEGDGEARLTAAGTDLASTVLKVGHHGSHTSSSAAFLRRVGARCAVISVGADNRFGHPDAAVLRRLEESGARVYRTDRDGAVVCRTDGKNLEIMTFVEANVGETK